MKILTICSLILATAPLFSQSQECTYTLQHPPAGSIIVFRNGIALDESEYTRSGSGGMRTIAITRFANGDRMMFYYSYQASAAKVYQPTKEYHSCTGNQNVNAAWVMQQLWACNGADLVGCAAGFARVCAIPRDQIPPGCNVDCTPSFGSVCCGPRYNFTAR